jgi:serine/threonine protein kinase
MSHVTRCPHCNTALQVPQDAGGRAIRCPVCKQLFAVRVTQIPMPAAAPIAQIAVSTPAAKPALGASGNTGLPKQTNSAPARATGKCPGCGADTKFGHKSCPECGYLLSGDTSLDDAEAAPNLCPNESCGVANPPEERHCQRCGSPLPYPSGTVLHGRFRIDKLLAIGGFSAVYLAGDLQNGGKAVAVKDMICNEPQEYQVRLAFFQREAEILKALAKLPTVPRFHGFYREGKGAQLVLEYIAGQDLLRMMESNSNTPFPFEQVVGWGKEVCDVLSHMHTQNPPIVHRDIKPENIMLLREQNSIRMIDFGTARDIGRSSGNKPAAMTRVYTEGYAAPEQILGKPEARSDLFALAGTLYHLATGKAPDFHTARELEQQLKGAATPWPEERRWFFELLHINLAEDLSERYFSCREFKADLEKRQVTRETNCSKCSSPNPVRQPYCCQCGAALTDFAPPCQQCGKNNRLGSRWCIHCGHRL